MSKENGKNERAKEMSPTYESIDDLWSDLPHFWGSLQVALYYLGVGGWIRERVETEVLRRASRYVTKVPRRRGQISWLRITSRRVLWNVLHARGGIDEMLPETYDGELVEIQDEHSDLPFLRMDLDLLRDRLLSEGPKYLAVFELRLVRGEQWSVVEEALGRCRRMCYAYLLHCRHIIDEEFSDLRDYIR